MRTQMRCSDAPGQATFVSVKLGFEPAPSLQENDSDVLTGDFANPFNAMSSQPYGIEGRVSQPLEQPLAPT